MQIYKLFEGYFTIFSDISRTPITNVLNTEVDVNCSILKYLICEEILTKPYLQQIGFHLLVETSQNILDLRIFFFMQCANYSLKGH